MGRAELSDSSLYLSCLFDTEIKAELDVGKK